MDYLVNTTYKKININSKRALYILDLFQKNNSKDLWNSDDHELWLLIILNYKFLIQNMNPKFLILDEWYNENLKNLKFLTKENHIDLLKWKMYRGKWRYILLKYANEVKNDEVENLSMLAIQNKDTKIYTKVKGVGIALSSALLASHYDDIPFFSDELIEIILPNGNTKYSLREYETCVKHIDNKIENLKNSEWKFSRNEIEKCLFALNQFHKN